ncbi:MAG: DNA repair protein RecN [Elusimicrobiota bacterium]
MLVTLVLKNYIFIDEIEIPFSKGFTVFTGETGAGKSIVVSAIELVLGEKIKVSCVQKNKDFAEITAQFIISDEALRAEFGCESEEVILRRRIDSDGKSRCYINERLVGISALEQFGERLVDIHGQHSHQILLKTNEQRDIVDRFAGVDRELDAVRGLYFERKKLNDLLNTEESSKKLLIERVDLYKFQKDEIDKIDPKPGEIEELEEEYEFLRNRDKIIRMVDELGQDISTADGSVLERLSRAEINLEALSVYGSNFKNLTEELKSTIGVLREIADQALSFSDNIEFDPKRLEIVSNRLEQLHYLRKKYGNITEYREKISKELDRISTITLDEQELKERLDETSKSLFSAAEKLSDKRKKASQKLEKMVEYELSDVGMEKVKVKIDITDNLDDSSNINISECGYDEIEFLVQTNVGSDFKPLRKIASGGELSRIMLALKSAMASYDKIPFLVFDEIDTGLSGKIASMVGKKMYGVSKNHQVLCITHLPQVAAYSDEQYVISKSIKNNAPNIEIKIVREKERLNELGRMLGGNKVTDITLSHAKELFELAAAEKARRVDGGKRKNYIYKSA